MNYFHALGAGAAAILLLACTGTSDKNQNPEVGRAEYQTERNRVDTMILRPREFALEILGNGKLRALRKSVLKFGGTGDLAEVRVVNGQRVEEGEVLAVLNPRQSELKLRQARQDMQKAEIDLTDNLIGFGYGSDTAQVPKDILKVALIRSGYTTAKNNLELAQMELAATVLKAPFAGKVANVGVKAYEQVPEAFCTLIDDRFFQVDFNLLESEIPFAKRGHGVKVSTFLEPEAYYEGRITEINPLVDEKGQINIRAEIPNTSGLLMEGMNVRVVLRESLSGQWAVPKSAVVIRANQEVLFRYGPDGKAMWTYVDVLMSNSDSHVVAPNRSKGAELNPGDAVIVSGNLNLADGSRVEIRQNPKP